ncbi:MAG: IS66 family insertion sequence element accessory protein TnpB [Sandaracinaceae bacterium]|nr:IS66 family insertion sequence element accessory protein TnpB [Sandaracinaceae bacterium]
MAPGRGPAKSGALFVFTNKRSSRIKVCGSTATFLLLYKRLHKARFRTPGHG